MVAGKENDADIVMIELGGTAGEYWNIFYYEAARLLAFRNPGDVIHIHVSYVPTPGHLGEPKTKPTQLSVRTLNSMGIQPDFIIARAEKPLDDRRKERFATFCNMHTEDIISNPDVSSVYEIPSELLRQDLPKKILQKLQLPVKKPKIQDWERLVETIKAPKTKTAEIVIVGKYFGTGEYQLKDSYAALFDAIDHAAWGKDVVVTTRWVDAEKVEKEGAEKIIGRPDGIIVPIGWGVRGAEGMIAAASYARKEKIPYLGLCFGMQLASVAFARDMLGWKDANTEENNPKSKHKVIHFIKAQKKLIKKRAYGGTMRLGGWEAIVKKDTRAWDIYNEYGGFINKTKNLTSERHRHRYEFNSDFIKDFEKKGFVISATSADVGLVEIIELPESEHPFYLGTQGHPEYKSRPLTPHPIFLAFVEACARGK
jgi:CTP synthase